MSEKPNKFSDLDVNELRRSAIEDFAVEVGAEDSKKIVLAALTESGVAWADYVAQHPEVAPEEEEKAVDAPVNVVKSQKPTPPEKVRVKEEIPAETGEKFLIKMTRENPLFEVRGYRFTSSHPYALVDAADVEHILTKEEGFRQALPSELQDFYN